MSKLTLSFEEDYDFTLIGISCHTKDYRLCWELNRSLHIDLIRITDLEINKKNTTSSFSFYEFIDDTNYLDFYLISNLCNSGYLVSEQKKVDFFLMIKGNTDEYQTKDFIDKINSLSLVLTSFKINPESLKSKQNLLF
ncbi:MAG: IPExxxVDY family protein [Flavobacteriales bacterium]|nr:IPExxxVDY family protein [Flavobacteriales bacterium]NQX96770.1 IPExxxVDY family protein [Flavobacteriales bacterium]